MAIEMVTPIGDIEAYLAQEAERIEMLTIRALAMLGEKCVIEAKDRSPEASWFDQSGNLRSSIGYVIVANGSIVMLAGFEPVKQGSEGIKTGRALAESLAKSYSSGYALIVVAGMNYADRVEALDNKVVLASAELFARKEMPNVMERLKIQVDR